MTSAAVVDATGTRTLLVRPAASPRWGLISGHTDGGEPLGQACRREVRNGAGLVNVTVIEPHLAVQQDIIECGDAETRHVDHVFAVVADPDEPLAEGGDELRWFDLRALPEPLNPGVRLHLHEAVRMTSGR
jgi:ADP-ribose pyrophosphatase YjhB (NUDIX family)